MEFLPGTGLRAQQDAGATTPSVAPGAPAGSYALSGFENVNLYNGNLNFHLPLMQVGGRGAAGYIMTLPIETRWQIVKGITDLTGNGAYFASYLPLYNNWYAGDKPGYGPGKLIGRISSYYPTGCDPTLANLMYVLLRFTFVAPDGTEYELRDQLSDGQPFSYFCTNPYGGNRGNVFKSADGTAVTFVSDTNITDTPLEPNIYPSGHLMMRDGTRFRIDSGNVTWIQDRNGNKVSFIYDSQQRVTTITDSLNRQITISYYNPPSQAYDSITWKGYNNTQREIRVYYAALSTVLRGDFSPGTMIFPPAGDPDPDPWNPNGYNFDTTTVVSQVLLPNNQSYYFKYNPHLELAEVTLPTGGKYQYDWDAGPRTLPGAEGMDGEWGVPPMWPNPDPSYTGAMYTSRRVTQRRVLPDGSTLEGSMTYSATLNSSAQTTTVTVDHRDASNSLKAQDKHYFYLYPFALFNAPSTSYAPWFEGREYQTEAYDTSVNLLRRVVNTWHQRAPVSWCNCSADDSPAPNDPRITETVSTLADTNLVSKQTFGYDQYNNQTDIREYDFGSGAPPAYPTRHTHTDYLTSGYDTNTDIHLRNLPSQLLVYAVNPSTGAETLTSHITYEYDLYDGSANHAPLVDRPGVSGLDSGFTTGYTTRGNVTKVSRWLDTPSSWIYTYAQYDIAGNVVKAIDGRGHATDFEFNDRFGLPDGEARANTAPSELGGQTSYAFATKVTNALGQTTYTQYDYYLGRVVDGEDHNGMVSSGYYNDALDRPTQIIRANTASPTDPNRSQTTFTYNDASHLITTASDRDAFGDNLLKSEIVYDGLGRTVEARTYAPGPAGCSSPCYSQVKTTFDSMGRTYQVSNPYWNHESPIWTTTQYDALSRMTSLTTPDGATVSTAYNGAQVTVTDQAGKKRRSQTDAFGRLTMVTEDPGGLNFDTVYLYDVLGNLRKVTQGAQKRWFAYDSLSRLIRAKNPEQADNTSPNMSYTDPVTGNSGWSMAYSYDENGNLTSRIDARDTTTTIIYDTINRPTSRSYTDGTTAVNYFYDAQALSAGAPNFDRGKSTGRLVAVTYGGGSQGSYYGYDSLGRVLRRFQQTGATNYQTQATYNKAGAVTGETYPSGRTVNRTYDQAGRVSGFSGNLGGSPSTYADTIGYNPAGQMIKERFGTNTSLYHNQHYNNRLQLVDTRLGDTNNEWSWSRGAINFFYGTTAASSRNLFASDTDNNGNLRRQDNFVPLASGGYVTPQDDVYTYDALNRVSSFTDGQIDSGGQPTNVASQNFSYDCWGNKKITNATGGVNNYNPTYDTTNNTNRIMGLGYDAAGNITSDAMTGGIMTYDAENRLLTATNGGVSGSYTYDADGRRVKRVTGGQETWHVYGIGGELLAEYAANGASNAPQKEYGYRGGQLLVIAEPGSGGNLAWGKATSQSSTAFGGESSRGVDGNTSGNWGDNSVSHTNSEHQPWWQVDLGSVQQIGTVRLWNRTDCCSDRLSNFYVLVSDNPFSSTDLTTTINQVGVSSYYTAGPAGLLTQIGVGRSGRYVRVQLAGDNYLSLAEVEVMAGTGPVPGVKWLVQDHLGSTRMVVDYSGSLAGIRRDDFAPFGEELTAGTAIRSESNGYSGDSVRQKFTSKERDNETNLDYFGARYYSSTEGRFISSDPIFITKDRIFDPQRLNLYAYVRNNPLLYNDPTGADIHIVITNVVTSGNVKSQSHVNSLPGGQGTREKVNTYKMIITNDSGSKREFNVTRDTNYNGPTSETRGQYISQGETPPGEYSGKIRTDGKRGFRIEMSDVDKPGTGKIDLPDGTTKENAQIHIGPGCSEGCILLTGGPAGRDAFETGVTTLRNEDKKNNYGDDINVTIQPRNTQENAKDEPNLPRTKDGTIRVIVPEKKDE